MHKLSIHRLSALLLGVSAALPATIAQAQELLARVITSTAVLQQVAVPRQVCTQQQVVQPGQTSGAGAAMGALAGGALGNAVGSGTGRDIATVIGLVGGAVLGNRVEGTRDEVRNVQQCTTQTTYENRVLHYDVVYEHDGKRYSIKMPNDPGQYVRLQLNPVGALPPAPSGVAPAPTTIFTPLSGVPAAPAVTLVQPAPVYVHPAATVSAPFYVYPVAQPVYRPHVAPVALSLHWSNARPHGHVRGHLPWYHDRNGYGHWR